MRPLLVSALLLVLVACTPAAVDRAAWEAMPAEDRVLYVRSLIGEEQAKQAKGGDGKRMLRTAEEYVRLIDAAYTAGDSRSAQAIFQAAHESDGTRGG